MPNYTGMPNFRRVLFVIQLQLDCFFLIALKKKIIFIRLWSIFVQRVHDNYKQIKSSKIDILYGVNDI